VQVGVPTGLLFAATHPERTTALVLINATARVRRAEDYPEGLTDEQIDGTLVGGLNIAAAMLAPSLVGDGRFVRWLDRASRLTCPPEDMAWRGRLIYDIDVRDALSAIRVPTLVVSRRERRTAAQTRYVADHIAGARYVELPGADVLPFVGDANAILDAVEEFLTGKLASPELDRVLATLLFTDLVDSTAREAAMGDQRWRELLATHDGIVRDVVEEFRGRTVKFTGDGVLAIFDGPARGIRCAVAIRDRIRALDLDMRAGLHTGEIDLLDDDVSGIAVNIAQRVASTAGRGEVLVSRTVADLLAGSNIQFGDRGEHQLKGVPGTWRLFHVAD
jgi:class 3 adenylate cyclase